MSNQQILGMQLAQLSRDASAAVSMLCYELVLHPLNFGIICGHLLSGLLSQLCQGAARRLGTQKKNVEVVESVGVAGKSDSNRTLRYFRLEVILFPLHLSTISKCC